VAGLGRRAVRAVMGILPSVLSHRP
jgi:hypothetical protein